VSWFTRNSQFMSSFSSSTRKNFSSISRSRFLSINPCLFLLFFFSMVEMFFAHCFVSLKSYLYVYFWIIVYSKTECKYTKTFPHKIFLQNYFQFILLCCNLKLNILCFTKYQTMCLFGYWHLAIHEGNIGDKIFLLLFSVIPHFYTLKYDLSFSISKTKKTDFWRR
jgi:hypothetical protein